MKDKYVFLTDLLSGTVAAREGSGGYYLGYFV